MERTAGLGHLSTNDWERLQEILDRFEKAWSNVASEDVIDLKAYLPGSEDLLRPVALQELIKADLEIRWRRGLTARIESYVNDFPELQVVGTLSPLIYEEYRVRQMHGDKPPVTAYQERFPREYEDLQRLVQEQPLPTVNQTDTPPGTSGKEEKPVEAASQGTIQSPSLPGNVGGFKKIKRLGSGGFGEVWLGEAPGGVPCAIKVVFRPIEHEAAQREKQSLDLIKRLRHPFLLATQQFFLEEEKLHIVMELADGSLRDRLKECTKAGLHGIPVGELIQYFREAAEAVDYLHSEHVIHRDIKPDNILILNKHAKLADFGLARFLENEQTASASGSGTPAYMAPEVWRRKVSEKSDQYSLAMSYVELRLDRSFSHDMMEVMLDHLERTLDLNPLPEPEQDVLHKALSKDPSSRYASCQEFMQALEQAVGPELGPGMFSRPRKDRDAEDQTVEGPRKDGSQGGSYDTLFQGAGTASSSVADPYSSKTRIGEATPRPAGWRDKGMVGVHSAVSAPQQQRRKALKMMLMGLALPVVAVAAFLAFKPFINSGKTDNGHSSKDSKEKDTQDGGSGSDPNKPTSSIYLPERCRNDGTEMEKRGDKEFYKRIAYDFGDGIKARFVVIPNTRPSDPPTFYMMENKVTIQAFRKFAEKNKAFIKSDEWRKGALAKGRDLGIENAQLPVTRVLVEDAYRFAVAMGGDLPSVQEWDKAAGRFEPNPPEGPFLGPWSSEEDKYRDQIAIDRGDEGPLEVGKATKDISIFGCRDMAGNGREWTCDLYLLGTGNERRVPIVNREINDYKDLVILRGRNYMEDRPLKFTDRTMRPDTPETLGYKKTAVDVGFRVVIEIPEKYQPK